MQATIPLCATLLAALLPCRAFAQRTETSPPGWGATESLTTPALSAHPFYAANARAQYVDDGLRGTPIAAISKVELRRDGTAPAGSYPARTTNLALLLAHASSAAVTTQFATNYAGVPTTVVARKKISLPDLSAPSGQPEPWSVAIPFDSGQGFSYDGNNALLVEFQCDGTAPADKEWPLDAVDTCDPGVGQVRLLDSFGYCLTRNGPFWLFVRPPLTSAANVVTLAVFARGAPSSAAGALGIGLTDPNLPGILCNNLRTSAEILLPVTSNATGEVGSPALPMTVPAPFVGEIAVCLQMVALDSFQAPRPNVALSDASQARLFAAGHAVAVQRVLASSSSILPGSMPSGVRSPLLGLVMRLSFP
jgi:hypothetical protein